MVKNNAWRRKCQNNNTIQKKLPTPLLHARHSPLGAHPSIRTKFNKLFCFFCFRKCGKIYSTSFHFSRILVFFKVHSSFQDIIFKLPDRVNSHVSGCALSKNYEGDGSVVFLNLSLPFSSIGHKIAYVSLYCKENFLF